MRQLWLLWKIYRSRERYFITCRTPTNKPFELGVSAFWHDGLIRYRSLDGKLLCPLQAVGIAPFACPIVFAADNTTPTLARRALLWATRL